MDDISRKFRSLDWKSFQKSARRMQASTASALKDLVMTDLENKTRSATSDTPWGASTTDLQTIAQGTYNRDDYALIMSIVWQRLGSSRWRCVYKALEVLKYLLMHGSTRCLEEAQGALGHLETLRSYRKMEGGRDVAEGVRRRAESVVEMLRDENVLQREKQRSEELRRKMVGGEGPYSGGNYNSGRYDDTGYTDDGVSRVGTSGFKGYGDDAPGAFKGYDDDTGRLKGYGGSNGAGAGAETEAGQKVGVDDLLGEEPVKDDDDDDEFDPRGNGGGPEKGGKEDVGELFGALALTEGDAPQPSLVQGVGEAAHGTGKESTSARVARLAAERAGAVVPVAPSGTHVPPTNSDINVWDDADGDGTAGGAGSGVAGSGMAPGVGIWVDGPINTPSATAPPVSVAQPNAMNNSLNKAPLTRVSKKDDDPFSDLLATARKTVL